MIDAVQCVVDNKMGGNKKGGTSRQSRLDKAHARAEAAAAAKAAAAAAAKEEEERVHEEEGFYEEIDGSMLEGGGQVVRGGCALAALLQRPVRITRVRAGRAQPGLKRQHVAGLQLLGELYGAGSLTGVHEGSRTITFTPTTFAWPPQAMHTETESPAETEEVAPLVLDVNVGTAGSVALVMQTAVPVLLARAGTLGSGQDVVLRVTGGTHVAQAPPVTYLAACLVPRLRAMGAACTVAVERYGFYPRGGGRATVRVGALHTPLAPLVDTDPRAPVVRCTVRVCVAGVGGDVGTRAAQAAVARLRERAGVPADAVECAVEDVGAASAGTGMWVEVYATTARGQVLGASSVGRRGVRAEAVAAEAAEHLLADLAQGGAVDEYLQDQLLVFMAMARGRSALRVGRLSLHTQTMVALVNQLARAPIVTTAPADDGHPGNIIFCNGLGLC